MKRLRATGIRFSAHFPAVLAAFQLLLSLVSGADQGLVGKTIPSLRLENGKIYNEVTFLRIENNEVFIRHAHGLATLPIESLPEDWSRGSGARDRGDSAGTGRSERAKGERSPNSEGGRPGKSTRSAADSLELREKIYFFTFLLCLGFLIFTAIGFSNSCPSCKKWWSKKFRFKSEIGRANRYKTITRTDIQKDRDGKVTGTVERQEQVHVTVVSYENHWSCRRCHHTWVTFTESEC